MMDAVRKYLLKDLIKWLKRYPNIRLVSRDESLSYAAAIAESIPKAIQVSDKFHLIKNLLDALSSHIKRSYLVNVSLKDDWAQNKDAINSGC